ncbi:helix-turn-helix transcriptional regulator [Staphylococcus epidermidis]|nr:WYL domain-containing protein [Staphylococcus epidermidis]MDX0993236.1 WYL domain-containing protein [Sinorhizobium medicae]MBF2337460.1 WYL domain-containing protein [Staphylococcus epidermidis]MBM0787207.1 WYL domain-containing protein [Staphylococcus epidermidis]MCA0116873.1 WYL domain-containing protein [Staphylococcus epidermidis]MCG1083548.1 WYL domain-containing protein [Staphylococcus epidermidis]
MNKTIRLYNLIEFCNKNRNFKLKDVMEEFNTSKSTALRDIKDIQELGVPLYSNGGKNGGYKVIRKAHTTRIDLNDEEIKSLYFALSSVSNLKSLPFSSEYISIVNKIYNSSTERQKSIINQYKNMFEYFNVEIGNEYSNDIFEKVINFTVLKKQFNLVYRSKYLNYIYQGIGLTYKNNVWYFVTAKVKTKSVRLFNLSKIEDIYEIPFVDEPLNINMKNYKQYLVENESKINITIECNEIGVDLLQNHLWSNITIDKLVDKYILKIDINKKDVGFVSKIIISCGKNVKVLSPESLRNNIKQDLQEILDYY